MQVHVIDVTSVEYLAAEDESVLTNSSRNHLNSVVSQRVKCSLLQSAHDFIKDDLDRGWTSVCRHVMEMIDPLTWRDMTWLILPLIYEVKHHLRQMIDIRIIRPSNSPYSPNMTPVHKANRELRFCIDLRKK